MTTLARGQILPKFFLENGRSQTRESNALPSESCINKNLYRSDMSYYFVYFYNLTTLNASDLIKCVECFKMHVVISMGLRFCEQLEKATRSERL